MNSCLAGYCSETLHTGMYAQEAMEASSSHSNNLLSKWAIKNLKLHSTQQSRFFMQGASENFFPHDADIGIIGRGITVENAFESAAQVVFSIMCDNLSQVKPQKKITIEFNESDLELAFVTWLNILIGEARNQHLVLSQFELKHTGSRWQGEAWGEPWHDELQRGTEVKGATLTMLSVKKISEGWEARCVVDV